MSEVDRIKNSRTTVRRAAEVAVEQGEVGCDAQTVRHLAEDHVCRVQQGRQTQLGFCDLESLQIRTNS